jgi:hypothetical protein
MIGDGFWGARSSWHPASPTKASRRLTALEPDASGDRVAC